MSDTMWRPGASRYIVHTLVSGKHAVVDTYIGGTPWANKTVSEHDNAELADKLCRLANSAWLDTVHQRRLQELDQAREAIKNVLA